MPGRRKKRAANFDSINLLYLIICSRGIGSETITVDSNQDEDGEGISESIDDKWTPVKLRAELKKKSVIEVGYADEGPVIALSKKAELKDIWGWLDTWLKQDDGCDLSDSLEESKDLTVEFKEQMKQLDARMKSDKEKYRDAFKSACLRAFVVYLEPDGVHNGPGSNWTSCNSWRSNEGNLAEALTEKQFKMISECITIDELLKWDCRVIRQACVAFSEEGKFARKGW